MKNCIHSLALLLCFSILFSCANPRSKSSSAHEGEVTISGKVINIEGPSSLENLEVIYRNFFKLQVVNSVEIKEDGSFTTSIPYSHKMDFFIGYGRILSTVLCEPNDNIYITIDADIAKDRRNRFPNGQYWAKVKNEKVVGENIVVNNFINEINNVIPFSIRYEAIKSKKPLEYLSFQEEWASLNQKVLDSLIRTERSDLFIEWAQDYIKYNRLNKLLRYIPRHAKRNELDLTTFNLPEEYLEAIFTERISTQNIFSFPYMIFLFEFHNYMLRKAKISDLEAIKYIEKNSKGFIKEFSIANYIYARSKESYFEKVSSLEKIKILFLRDLLVTQVVNDRSEILAYEGDVFTKNINSIFSDYRGSVLYVDFWASWCGPCNLEMRHSKKIMELFKGEAVKFLFLANNCSIEEWQKAIKVLNLKGEHIYLPNKQYKVLKHRFGITGIPHYVIIDKEGNIIDPDAPKPSDPKIIDVINELLKE